MFRRNTVPSENPVIPSSEEAELLTADAVSRIVDIDGVDHLDGWPLPPDDAELWNPGAIRGTITYCRFNEATGEPEYMTESYEHESTLTNEFIRACNIDCLAKGIPPLFITWDQSDLLMLRLEESQGLKPNVSWRGRVAELLGMRLGSN